jgi:catechol 2,3-dioxygenase-like lactoylglutathione lyase family enzyme
MHRSQLQAIVIDCDDIEAGIAFWTSALGTEVVWRGEAYALLKLRPGGVRLLLQDVPEPKAVKSRIHLDIHTDDVDAEVARLEALGARRQEFVNAWWVMLDRCGNEFCVVPEEHFTEDVRVWS